MRQTLFCVVGDCLHLAARDCLQRNQPVQPPRPRPLSVAMLSGWDDPMPSNRAGPQWLLQATDALSWMVRHVDMRPGAVAAILLPEGPRLRMKQLQGGGRTQRDFLHGISNMLSNSTLHHTRCQAPQRRKGKKRES